MKLNMKNISFLFFLTFVFIKAHAQEIKNMKTNPRDKTIEFYYELEGKGEYIVKLFYSSDDGETWKGPLQLVTGDVGRAQRQGINKKIVWDAASEAKTLEGYFQFKITAEEGEYKAETQINVPEKKAEPDLTKRNIAKSDIPINNQLKKTAYLKQKRRKNFWLVSTIISAGVGTYAYMQSESLYEEYHSASTNATSLRSQIETLDMVYPVAFGVAGFSMLKFIIHAGKQSKAKKLAIHPIHIQNGGGLAVSLKF